MYNIVILLQSSRITSLLKRSVITIKIVQFLLIDSLLIKSINISDYIQLETSKGFRKS